MSDKAALLGDETPMTEVEELPWPHRRGPGEGYLRFDDVARALEEADVTKEQVSRLHAFLDEQGIDIVGADGRLAQSEGGKHGGPGCCPAAAAEDRPGPAAKRPQIDLTVEPSLDSLRLYLRSIGKRPAAHGHAGGRAGQAHRARRHGAPSST